METNQRETLNVWLVSVSFFNSRKWINVIMIDSNKKEWNLLTSGQQFMTKKSIESFKNDWLCRYRFRWCKFNFYFIFGTATKDRVKKHLYQSIPFRNVKLWILKIILNCIISSVSRISNVRSKKMSHQIDVSGQIS